MVLKKSSSAVTTATASVVTPAPTAAVVAPVASVSVAATPQAAQPKDPMVDVLERYKDFVLNAYSEPSDLTPDAIAFADEPDFLQGLTMVAHAIGYKAYDPNTVCSFTLGQSQSGKLYLSQPTICKSPDGGVAIRWGSETIPIDGNIELGMKPWTISSKGEGEKLYVSVLYKKDGYLFPFRVFVASEYQEQQSLLIPFDYFHQWLPYLGTIGGGGLLTFTDDEMEGLTLTIQSLKEVRTSKKGNQYGVLDVVDSDGDSHEFLASGNLEDWQKYVYPLTVVVGKDQLQLTDANGLQSTVELKGSLKFEALTDLEVGKQYTVVRYRMKMMNGSNGEFPVSTVVVNDDGTERIVNGNSSITKGLKSQLKAVPDNQDHEMDGLLIVTSHYTKKNGKADANVNFMVLTPENKARLDRMKALAS